MTDKAYLDAKMTISITLNFRSTNDDIEAARAKLENYRAEMAKKIREITGQEPAVDYMITVNADRWLPL